MDRFRRRLRATVGTLASALLLAQLLLVPMLEGTGGGRKLVLESEHSAAACAMGHDHSICVQVGANRVLAGTSTALRLPVLRLASPASPHRVDFPPAAVARSDRTRAPPGF